MHKLRFAAVIAAVFALPAALAWAAGMWSTLPGIGANSFCVSYVSGVTLPLQQGPYGVVPGSTQGTGAVICGNTVPAGPTTFNGLEYAPFDTQSTTSNAATAVVSITQLGQGPMVDATSPVTATIPLKTPFYFLDGAQGSAFTITMPATAVEGQIQHVVCEATTVGTLTVAANAGQTLKNNPNAACTAGVAYHWRYQASNTTWYSF